MTTDDERPIFGDPAELVAASYGPSDLIRTLLAGLEPWRAEAACASEPTATFFPEVGGNYHRAAQVCGRCEVREECLAMALDDESLDWGFLGGMTANARVQRRKLNRARATR